MIVEDGQVPFLVHMEESGGFAHAGGVSLAQIPVEPDPEMPR